MGAYAGFHVNGLFEWNFGDAEIAMLLWMTVGLALASKSIKPFPVPEASVPGPENSGGAVHSSGEDCL